MASWELGGLARGSCLTGAAFVSVGKMYGVYEPVKIVGPDQLFKCQLLKDESKANVTGANELIGVTRSANPTECAVNAMATMLIARFGKDGVVGKLPNFLDFWNDWPSE